MRKIEQQITEREYITSHLILATVSLRRLLGLRNHPQHGQHARFSARQWLRSIRNIRTILEA